MMEKKRQLNTYTLSTDEDLNVALGVPSQLVQARPDYVVVEGVQRVPDCMGDKEIRPSTCSTWVGNTDNSPECKLLLCIHTEPECTSQASCSWNKRRCCKTYLIHILCVVTSFLALLKDSWLDLLTSYEVSESETISHISDCLPQNRPNTESSRLDVKGDIVCCLKQDHTGCLPQSATQEHSGSMEAGSVKQGVSHFISERPFIAKINLGKPNEVIRSLLDTQQKVQLLDFKEKRKRQKKVNHLCEIGEEDFHFLRPVFVSAFVYPVNQQRSGQTPASDGGKQAQDAPQTQNSSNGQWPPESVYNIPWSAFREELQRLMTFADIPINAPVFVLRLAQTGLLCLPDGRIVCYFCGLNRNAWNAGDVPAEIHRRLSPLCPMVTGINCDNQPVIVVPEEQVENLLRIWSLQRAAAPRLTLSGEVADSLGKDPADNLGQGLGQVPQSSRGGATALPAGASPMPSGPTSLSAVHGVDSQTAATPAAYSRQ